MHHKVTMLYDLQSPHLARIALHKAPAVYATFNPLPPPPPPLVFQAKRMKALEASLGPTPGGNNDNNNAEEEEDEAAAAAAAAALAAGPDEGNTWDAGAVAENFEAKLPLADRIRLKVGLITVGTGGLMVGLMGGGGG